MRDSVLSARYSSVCNVLRQWSISLIPTYRVYRLYDIVLQWTLTNPNSLVPAATKTVLISEFVPITEMLIQQYSVL